MHNSLLKTFDCKEKRLTKGKPGKKWLGGDYKKNKSYGIKYEAYSGFVGENSNSETNRTKTVALSGSLVFSIPNFQKKNLIGTVKGYGSMVSQWIGYIWIRSPPGADTMARYKIMKHAGLPTSRPIDIGTWKHGCYTHQMFEAFLILWSC